MTEISWFEITLNQKCTTKYYFGPIHKRRPSKTRISRPLSPLHPDKTIESHSNNNWTSGFHIPPSPGVSQTSLVNGPFSIYQYSESYVFLSSSWWFFKLGLVGFLFAVVWGWKQIQKPHLRQSAPFTWWRRLCWRCEWNKCLQRCRMQ